MLTALRAGRSGYSGSIPGVDKWLIAFISFMSVLGPTQPPTMGTRSFFLGIKGPGHETNKSLHLMQRLEMSGLVSPLPHTPSWLAREDFAFSCNTAVYKLCTLPSEFRNVSLSRISNAADCL